MAATLNTAITAIGSTNKTLMLTATDRAMAPCTWMIDVNVTIPRNITLWVPQGARASINTGITITANGPVQADDPDWYSGAGTVVFNYKSWGSEESYSGFFQGVALSGCVHATSATTTSPAFACVARTDSGRYINQPSTTITYSGGNNTYQVIAHKDTTTAVGGWTRQSGTRFLWQVNANPPTVPADSLWILTVKVVGGQITTVAKRSAKNAVRTMQPFINVQDYGAAGDGVTDDTAALNAAVATAPTGSTILIPGGTYLTGTIDARNRSDLRFQGQGWPTLKRITPESAFEINPGNPQTIWLSGASRILIEGLQIDANGKTQYGGIGGSDTAMSHITIRHNRFFDSNPPGSWTGDAYAIAFGIITTGNSSDIRIEDNVLDLAQIEVDDAERVWIIRNTLLRPPTNGIIWSSLAANSIAIDYHVEENLIENAGSNGIAIVFDGTGGGLTVRNIWVERNTVRMTNTSPDARFPIVVGHPILGEIDTGSVWQDIHVNNNQVIWFTTATSSTYHPLMQVGVSDNVSYGMVGTHVEGNTVQGAYSLGTPIYAERGIYVHRPSSGVIARNIVRHTNVGIEVSPVLGGQVTVADNVVEEISTNGIVLDGFRRPATFAITGNVLRGIGNNPLNTHNAIFLKRGASHGSVTGNSIDAANTLWGVREDSTADDLGGTATGNSVTGNRIRAPVRKVLKNEPQCHTNSIGTGVATTATTLQALNIPGTMLGFEGMVHQRALGRVDGTTNTKTVRMFFGTAQLAEITYAAGESGSWSFLAEIAQDDSESAQTIDIWAYKGTTLSTRALVLSTQNAAGNITIKTEGTTVNNNDEVTSDVLCWRTHGDL